MLRLSLVGDTGDVNGRDLAQSARTTNSPESIWLVDKVVIMRCRQDIQQPGCRARTSPAARLQLELPSTSAKAQCDLGSTSSDGAASDGTDRPRDAQKHLPSDEARQRVAVEAPGYPPALVEQGTAARTTTTTCSCPELAAADADWPSTPAWDA